MIDECETLQCDSGPPLFETPKRLLRRTKMKAAAMLRPLPTAVRRPCLREGEPRTRGLGVRPAAFRCLIGGGPPDSTRGEGVRPMRTPRAMTWQAGLVFEVVAVGLMAACSGDNNPGSADSGVEAGH